LSRQMTCSPRATRTSHRCEPMKPAPPVTKLTLDILKLPMVLGLDSAFYTLHSMRPDCFARKRASAACRIRPGDLRGHSSKFKRRLR